jgi:hypothetical protein
MVDVMLGAIAADEKSSTLGGLYGIPAGRFVELYGAGLGLASLQKYRDGLVWVLEATPQEEETIIANSGPVDWARQENGELISFVVHPFRAREVSPVDEGSAAQRRLGGRSRKTVGCTGGEEEERKVIGRGHEGRPRKSAEPEQTPAPKTNKGRKRKDDDPEPRVNNRRQCG